MDRDVVENDFEMKSVYCVHSKIIAAGKDIEALILQAMG